jgi:hypothetical protein
MCAAIFNRRDLPPRHHFQPSSTEITVARNGPGGITFTHRIALAKSVPCDQPPIETGSVNEIENVPSLIVATVVPRRTAAMR